jgi:hypothetical protein
MTKSPITSYLLGVSDFAKRHPDPVMVCVCGGQSAVIVVLNLWLASATQHTRGSGAGHEGGDSSLEFKKDCLLDFGFLVVYATIAAADLASPIKIE